MTYNRTLDLKLITSISTNQSPDVAHRLKNVRRVQNCRLRKQLDEDVANLEEREIEESSQPDETNQPDSTQKVGKSPYACRQREYRDTKRANERMPSTPRKKPAV